MKETAPTAWFDRAPASADEIRHSRLSLNRNRGSGIYGWMLSIPSGKRLPAEIRVGPGSARSMIIRPSVIMTTPTIRRSIAAATTDLAALLATPNGEFFEYSLVPEACVHGDCAGALWDTYLLGAHIPLSESITYILDDGLHAIELKGDEAPDTWHFLRNQPITALMKHPLLDPAEMIVEISTFRPDDPVDAVSSTWIKLDCDRVPLFPDIFVVGRGASRGHPHG